LWGRVIYIDNLKEWEDNIIVWENVFEICNLKDLEDETNMSLKGAGYKWLLIVWQALLLTVLSFRFCYQ
jgi:hypothetical protein